ncbi:NADP-dependent phosphogluconate dehydrogenase [Streptomyces roseolus]|uniref:NADP-dependent phosphogluconate dehydrogenase n=1 Tax=Streptomyces roseolus TaxID=67358 RepID=UPI0037A73DB7
MPSTAQIGVIGLAATGRNLARNLARRGYAVAVHSRAADRTRGLVDEFGHEGTFLPARTARELLSSLERPRRLLITVRPGEATDSVIAAFAPLLEPGDLLVDGGDAHFADTRRREAELGEHGIHFVGAGIAGGEEKTLYGPSITVGGSPEAYEVVGPVLETIATRTSDGRPAATRVGPDGAGHFVKMVHDGIAHATMELTAEAYDLLRGIGGFSPERIADVFARWDGGRLGAHFTEITTDLLARTAADADEDRRPGGRHEDGQGGSGRRTARSAQDADVPVAGIAAAVFDQALSGLAAWHRDARRLPGPEPFGRHLADTDAFVREVEQALYASKVVVWAQGWHRIVEANGAYGWDIDLGVVSSLWGDDSLVPAPFLDRIAGAHGTGHAVPCFPADASFTREFAAAQRGWRGVVATAARGGVPAPALSTALSYYDTLRAERLPAAPARGRRDLTGPRTGYRAAQHDDFIPKGLRIP